ncbi:5-guanidino-2-oxopentanoate decarboxylase [Tateyamaria omphalii]|uniref:Acetolactate synthase isozyme1 large subunit n=1 Tax=Tateyamaria omphalii TaxID=299262 RepID=A0A1P8MSS0_9RHOB|nr:5-guanidino-2-oxopentanoate decarboxylase [Tateyamaria omphalii]APX11101.1 acetolactate synthase isozyme1 large subunit [Tateyamaria omphalii]
MTQNRPLGAQISHMLKDRGVDVIFGIPGVHNQEMYRGIEEAGITHVLARHEQGAGFMADGYARATGRPGVAYVITGPGLTNIMTPMGQAYSDSVPMLVISSCLDETAATKGQLHQMKDQRAAAETVCDWSEEARTAEAAYALIDRALMEFDTRRARPKHLQVPIRVLEADAPSPPPTPNSELAGDIPRDDLTVRRIADALMSAKRPAMVLGGGATIGASLYPKLADAVGAAVFTSYAGRGIMPPDHPLSFGATLARPESARVLNTADLVLVVGCELAEVDLWRSALGCDAPMIRIDIDPAVLATHQRSQDRIVLGEGYEIMEAVLDAVAGQTPATLWNTAEIAQTRTRWRAEVDAERPGIVPVCNALRDCLPDGTMIYSDMTQFAYTAKEVWDMDRPGHWHHPTGFGTLGYATPAAIGGAVARNGKPTMAIIGDYGFHYTMQELGVAVELGLPLPIILWDNGKLKEIEESMVRAQIAPNAVVARNPDFCKLAEAFGASSEAPHTLHDMQNAVRAAFDADGPTLIYLTPDIAIPT